MRTKYSFGLLCFVLVVFLNWGCTKPYVKAHTEYWSGRPESAREILQPEVDKHIKKNTKERNLFLWDMGMYCFSGGDFECAADMFERSVQAYQEVHGTGKTLKSIFTSAASQTYAGDPIEISTAWLFMGLSFRMLGKASDGMVALRRSTEEDICRDADCSGNMVVTNFLMGEYYRQLGELDDAIVAFRRTLDFRSDYIPAYIGLYESYSELGEISNADQVLAQLEEKVDPSYFADIKRCKGQGAYVVIYGERCPIVTKDAWTGAFRKRRDLQPFIRSWQVSTSPNAGQYSLILADDMRTHVHEQGGFGDEAKKQTTRLVSGTVMKQIPCVSLFAPSTDADVRYWVTMPGSFHIGYIPLVPGAYEFQVNGYNHKGQSVAAFAKNWTGIEVNEGDKPLIFASSYGSNALQ